MSQVQAAHCRMGLTMVVAALTLKLQPLRFLRRKPSTLFSFLAVTETFFDHVRLFVSVSEALAVIGGRLRA